MVESKQRCQYSVNATGALNCEQGKQNSFAATPIGNGPTWSLVFSQGARFYNLTIPAWVTVGTGGGAAGYNKMLCKSVESILNVTNQSPSTTEVDLYYCMVKKTNNDSADPGNRWSLGYAEEQGNSSIAGSFTHIDAKPTDVKRFNEEYRVIKKVMWKLLPGEEAQINFKFNVNRYVDQYYCDKFNQIEGITVIPMFVIRGIPGTRGQTLSGATNAGNWSTAAGAVTTTPSKIAVVHTLKYQAVMCSSFPRITVSSNNLVTAGINPTAAATANSVYTISDAAGTTVDNNNPLTYA